MKRLFTTTVIIISFLWALSSHAQESSSFSYTQVAVDFAQTGDYDQAASILKRGVEAGEKVCYGKLAQLYLALIPNENEFTKWSSKGMEAKNAESYYWAIVKLLLNLSSDSELFEDKYLLSQAANYAYEALGCDDYNLLEDDHVAYMIQILIAYYADQEDMDSIESILNAALEYCPNHPVLLGQKAVYWYANEKYEEAYQAALLADKEENVQGTFILGYSLLNGEGCDANPELGLKKLKKVAPMMPEAAYSVGQCYYEGIEVEKNLDEAVKWLRKAADKGHEDAQKLLNSILN